VLIFVFTRKIPSTDLGVPGSLAGHITMKRSRWSR